MCDMSINFLKQEGYDVLEHSTDFLDLEAICMYGLIIVKGHYALWWSVVEPAR